MEKDFSFLHELITISAHDQSFKELAPEHLWLLKTTQGPEEVFGPYLEGDIEKLISHFRPELSQLLACNLAQKYWQPFFHYDCFDLRKNHHAPQLKLLNQQDANGQNLAPNSDLYHYLHQGIKKGPISVPELKQAMEQGVLKADCLVSNDQGKSWLRAYQTRHFDRRFKLSNITQNEGNITSIQPFNFRNKKFLDQSSGLLIAKENFLSSQQDMEHLKLEHHKQLDLQKYKNFFLLLILMILATTSYTLYQNTLILANKEIKAEKSVDRTQAPNHSLERSKDLSQQNKTDENNKKIDAISLSKKFEPIAPLELKEKEKEDQSKTTMIEENNNSQDPDKDLNDNEKSNEEGTKNQRETATAKSTTSSEVKKIIINNNFDLPKDDNQIIPLEAPELEVESFDSSD